MPRSATTGWTDAGPRFVVAAIALLACGVMAGAETGAVTIAYAVAALACVVAAIWLDGFGGLVVALAGAAGVIAVKRATGVWGPGVFALTAYEVLALLILGWACGLLGQHLRSAARRLSRTSDGAVVPAYSSLGLLDRPQAMLRLDDELARARRGRRPLGLLLVRVEITDPELDTAARTAALRTVARLVESLVAESDLPFALGSDEVGAILPDTTAEQAWRLLGPFGDEIATASFADRARSERPHLLECARVTTGLALTDGHTTSGDLVAEARIALGSGTGAAA